MTITLRPEEQPPALRGRGLRFVLVSELMTSGELTVAELVEIVARRGYRLAGRPSKVISDALRWEVRRSRVARIARGRYRFLGAPASTARRIRLLAAAAREWIGQVRAGVQPPPARPDPRAGPLSLVLPSDPPWIHLGWLWAR